MKERILRTAGPGSGSDGNTNFNSDAKAVYITEADSRDPQKYRAAKEQAAKKGIPIITRPA